MILLMKEKITYENGKEYGIGVGEIRGTIKTYQRMNVPDDIIIENLQDIYNLSEQEAEEYLRNI